MIADLELTVLQEADDERGYVAGFAITDQMLLSVGGTSSTAPTVLASSNARHFEERTTPVNRGLRDVLAVADRVWVCGEYGQLASSRDHGATWEVHETGTDGCLYALTLALDGALWVVGDDGYAARVLGERPQRVDLGTRTRLANVIAVRDEVVVLGFDGSLYRWRDGKVTQVATGATTPLTSLVVTKSGTWVVTGDGGFLARSPDGTWFSRVKLDVSVDLEGIGALADGTLVIVGDRGTLLVSTDDGRTWRTIATKRPTAHLWSVERFGGGVLIGGDAGLILKLAPRADATWADRVNVFGGARPLDEIFVRGPQGFIATGLPGYLEAIAEDDDVEGEEDDDDDDDDDGPGGNEDDGDDDDDDDDDDDEDDVDDDGDDVFHALAQAGDADDFAAIYGVPLPDEARALFDAMIDRNRWSSFEELRLDNDLRPDVGERNLFELMVRRNQKAYLGTDLVEAFCGVFGVGSQGNGDTYHMEIYAWDDGPRQVLHFDHETASFSQVFADSLDSLVFLAALVKAREDKLVSQEAFEIALRKLRGKVAPTWHFSIDEKDPDFIALEPRRRDSEFFFYRARWICALLKNDGVTDISDIPELFNADFNQITPPDQLPARYEACEKYIPTALYATWRAYLFDEPELDTYLAIARTHAARLVRDAAKLIDELRAGRNELGTIEDVRGWLAAFRALDLDPRRAEARGLEAAARAKEDAARNAQATAELRRTSRDRWPELAWRWIDDGLGQRALLSELATEDTAGLLTQLDELPDLSGSEREAAISRIARELSPELEAILVGAIVREDTYDGVLAKAADDSPPGGASGDDDDWDDDDEDDDVDEEDAGDDDDDRAPGWQAIDDALAPIYGDAKPLHYGTVVPYMLGGNDPLHGISAYPRTEPVPHWHFVTYGFTDLFGKETDDPDESGFGFELTFRLACSPDDHEPPPWAINFLQNLARYVFGTGNRFAAGHKMGLNGPIALGHDTAITAICFANDPELGEFSSEHGKATFIQIVGITDDEYKLIQEWSTPGLVDILRARLPHLVTDLHRASVLADPATAREVETRVTQEGSSEDLTFAGEMGIEADDGRVRLELGALYAAVLPRAMRGRIRHGRPYELRGRAATLHLRPGSENRYLREDGDLILEITQELAREIEHRLRDAFVGDYRFDAWPALQIVVTVSFIRAQDGSATEVRGIADPDEASRLLAEHNAAHAAGASADEDDDDDEDDSDDDVDDEDDSDDDVDDDDSDDELDDDAPPAPRQVLAALGMTERALRLSPDDPDVQFTHAMLLVDADRAGLESKFDELRTWLPRFVASVRINVAVRLGKAEHPRFVEAVDLALEAHDSSYGDVADELYGELGEALLVHAPDRLTHLVPMLPAEVSVLSDLAWKAVQAQHVDAALALYERLLALPIPDDGDARTNYLRALNNACVQAHAAKAFEAAVRIADRAQPVAHENPYIYHSAACAYAAIGDYSRALDQVRLAIQHEYDHVNKVEVDSDLGPLLDMPEFKALFRDWHAREEGN